VPQKTSSNLAVSQSVSISGGEWEKYGHGCLGARNQDSRNLPGSISLWGDNEVHSAELGWENGDRIRLRTGSSERLLWARQLTHLLTQIWGTFDWWTTISFSRKTLLHGVKVLSALSCFRIFRTGAHFNIININNKYYLKNRRAATAYSV
jgi:hypothetical protein